MMETIGWIIGIAGMGALLVGSVWFLVVAFQFDSAWGVACLLIPFVSIVFLVKYWSKARIPFVVWVGGWICLFFGAFLREL